MNPMHKRYLIVTFIYENNIINGGEFVHAEL